MRKRSGHTGLQFTALLLTMFVGCKTPANIQSAPPTSKVNDELASKTEVVSIILRAYSSHDHAIAFEINSIIKKEGYYKNLMKGRADNYLKAIISDKKGRVLDSCFFENPLNKRLEYSDDSGKIATITRKDVEGYASIRVNYSTDVKVLTIYDLNGTKLSAINLAIR